jgi:hypothetical protein
VKRIVWTEPAKADVRRLSKPDAMHILSALHRFAADWVDFRLQFTPSLIQF